MIIQNNIQTSNFNVMGVFVLLKLMLVSRAKNCRFTSGSEFHLLLFCFNTKIATSHRFVVQHLIKIFVGVPILAQRLTNPTSIHVDAGSIPGLA